MVATSKAKQGDMNDLKQTGFRCQDYKDNGLMVRACAGGQGILQGYAVERRWMRAAVISFSMAFCKVAGSSMRRRKMAQI